MAAAATTAKRPTRARKGSGQGVGGGRPRKDEDGLERTIYLRISAALCDKLDALVERHHAEHGVNTTRADMIRKLLEDATRRA